MSTAINITVKYFASIREAIGVNSEVVAYEANTVMALRDMLIAKGSPYDRVLARGKSVRTALNQVMCDESASLAGGCEVAFFPPVTGG
jgi:molybdopterin synthase sulfur carrier subunit